MSNITYKQFQDYLSKQCLYHPGHNTTQMPASVAQILFTGNPENQRKLVIYYIKNYEGLTIFDYVKFIRAERNKLFPNNYKVFGNKFISGYGIYKKMSIAKYLLQI